jgi:hypothetical protein
MGGRDDLGLLAWSQRKMNPMVLVYQYNNPLDIKRMHGDAIMEYRALVFRYHVHFSMGLKGQCHELMVTEQRL